MMSSQELFTGQCSGKIHSIETCGTVDGPGVRFVVFFQGCPLRCLYCHNPDSWEINSGSKMSCAEIFEKYKGVKEFTKGGITATGGEPLLQIDFLIELFRLFKKERVHTCLDTSGALFNSSFKYDELIKYTDLVLLDIKHINDVEHKKLTGVSNKNILEFAKYLSKKDIPVWIRHVVLNYEVPEYLTELGKFIRGLKNVKALDVLPYHNMAHKKYKELGIDYPLKDLAPTTKEEAIRARDLILKL